MREGRMRGRKRKKGKGKQHIRISFLGDLQGIVVY